jgi:spore coat protein CotH
MRGSGICFFLLFSFTGLFSQANHWETLIKANEQWRYFPGTLSPPAVEPAATWRTLSFDDSGWLQGPGGFGYADDDDATLIPEVMSVFMRKKFIVVDKTKIEAGVLSVDYDDGFVAYLNGTEIARANMDGKGEFPAYTTNTSGFGDEGLVDPLPFTVSKETLQGLLIEGENVLSVQVHNENIGSSDLTSNVYLTVGINDGSFTYQTPPAWFQPPPEPIAFTSSDLPIIVITTNGGQGIPDDPKILATMGVIDNGPGNRNNLTDPYNNYSGYIGIETRGESSQMFPKKSYSVETVDAAGENINVELLGFPAENDWILYAPYTDKSMMRNEITFKLSRDIGRYASRTRACEVVLNGDYQGIYTLMEKIKVDNNRVDIASLNPDEISGDDLTGGYVLRVDKWDGNDYPSWQSGGIDFQYFDPEGEDLVTQQRDYIRAFINSVNASISSTSFKDPATGYQKYIDVPSFIDNMLLSELGKNVDGFRFSTYMYKNKDSNGGKLVLGPLWDFNLAYGNVDYNDAVEQPSGGWLYNDFRMFWFARLMSDPAFQDKMKTRWDSLREDELSNTRITFLIDSMAASLSESQVRNYERWPILNEYVWPNQYVGGSYAAEVAWFKNWIITRANWMDANLPGSIITDPDPDPITGTDDEFIRAGLSVYPNPGKDVITIEWQNPSHEPCEVQILNLLGQEIFSSVQRNASLTWRGEPTTGKSVQRGMYIVRVKNSRGARITAKLVKE